MKTAPWIFRHPVALFTTLLLIELAVLVYGVWADSMLCAVTGAFWTGVMLMTLIYREG